MIVYTLCTRLYDCSYGNALAEVETPHETKLDLFQSDRRIKVEKRHNFWTQSWSEVY